MELIRNYHLSGEIVIAADAPKNEAYAAAELRYYFNRMTSYPARIQPAAERLEEAVIVIGGALPLYGEARESYADDELHWYVKDGRIFFDGGCRGLLYGVYDFLETMGCRFFTPECERVPTVADYTVAETDRRDKPALEYRNFYYSDTLDNPRFGAKVRTNGAGIPETGGKFLFANSHHSFYNMVPIDMYKDEHPDWFALIEGKRDKYKDSPHGWQLCLSNPEVIEKLIEETRKVLQKTPDARIVCVSQNDFGRSCECEKCRAIDEEEGGPSGLIIRMINQIAEALEAEYPNVLFETFAYTYGRFAPKKTKPRHNVSVQFCTIEACFAHPIEHECGWTAVEGFPKSTGDCIREWGSICSNLSIWDYVTVFWHYPQPHPNWYVLQPNMQFFVENGATKMFSQSNRSAGGGCDLDELRCYLVCKLMWDPYCDFTRHLTEFTDHFYGEAGACIREYIDVLCRKCAADNHHFNCYGHHDCSPFDEFLTPEILAQCNEILDRAEDAVRDDPVRRRRIRRIRAGIRFLDLRVRAVKNHEHFPAEMNELFEEMRSLGITRFEETADEHKTVQSFAEEVWRGNWATKP